jgi:organic radical activating enzyme|tara:strand:- start:1549 stop:3219 length:1671 start_codon:yes stop_codon:yes gene_type:complete
MSKGRQPNESFDDYRTRVIDPISDSFCGAKWYNATIWLGHGGTASCHHPPAHNIDKEEIKTNPSAIHNTRHKKKMRQMMLEGTRPKECEYCWKIEDMEKDADGNRPVSDRTFKTHIYTDKELERIANMDPAEDVNLKTLEIAFDRTCQFACSYCNPAFSTSWVKDIRTNGGYSNIRSDARGHFIDDAPYADPFEKDEGNPYVKAFWEWWPELSLELDELRITGGEPTMSASVWGLFDWFKENGDIHPNAKKMRYAINSNLGAKDTLIAKLAEATQHVERFHLYTSGEAFGAQGEYIRDGLDFPQFSQNCVKMLREGKIEGFHMMMTINALCLDSMVEFLDWVLELKREFGHNKPSFSVNILRFPSFQSALTLPDDLRTKYHDQLLAWHRKVQEKAELDTMGVRLVQDWEADQLSRLIEYLDVVKTPHRNTADQWKLEHDFKVFYDQYDVRRGKDFRKTFPNLVEWYDSLEVKPLEVKEEDIQKPKGERAVEIYAHREVDEDGVVQVVDVRDRKDRRKTGESQDDYDDNKYADEPDFKRKAGSSIGWDTDNDGLGGQ